MSARPRSDHHLYASAEEPITPTRKRSGRQASLHCAILIALILTFPASTVLDRWRLVEPTYGVEEQYRGGRYSRSLLSVRHLAILSSERSTSSAGLRVFGPACWPDPGLQLRRADHSLVNAGAKCATDKAHPKHDLEQASKRFGCTGRPSLDPFDCRKALVDSMRRISSSGFSWHLLRCNRTACSASCPLLTCEAMSKRPKLAHAYDAGSSMSLAARAAFSPQIIDSPPYVIDVLSFSHYYAAASSDSTVALFDRASLKRIRDLPASSNGSLKSIAKTSSAEEALVATYENGCVEIFDMRSQASDPQIKLKGRDSGSCEDIQG